MKKILFALACMFALVFWACDSNNNANTTELEVMDTTIVTGDTTSSVIVDSTVIDTNLLIKK